MSKFKYLFEKHQHVNANGLIAGNSIVSNTHPLSKGIITYGSCRHVDPFATHLKERDRVQSEERCADHMTWVHPGEITTEVRKERICWSLTTVRPPLISGGETGGGN